MEDQCPVGIVLGCVNTAMMVLVLLLSSKNIVTVKYFIGVLSD